MSKKFKIDFPPSPNNCGLAMRVKLHWLIPLIRISSCQTVYPSVCVKHHTQAYTPTKRDTHLGFCCSIHFSYPRSKSPSCPLHWASYFFGGKTFSSKTPWLRTFPAGKCLANTKEDPSLADAFSTPILFVFSHTMAWSVQSQSWSQAAGSCNS